DPTGCGDAYRAGFLCGLAAGQPLDVAGRMGSLMGARQVAVRGTQVQRIDLDGFRNAYAEVYGAAF
ncbi:MAG: PfkB family carbohydrate kinase, partial [Myxococcota bacterium]